MVSHRAGRLSILLATFAWSCTQTQTEDAGEPTATQGGGGQHASQNEAGRHKSHTEATAPISGGTAAGGASATSSSYALPSGGSTAVTTPSVGGSFVDATLGIVAGGVGTTDIGSTLAATSGGTSNSKSLSGASGSTMSGGTASSGTASSSTSGTTASGGKAAAAGGTAFGGTLSGGSVGVSRGGAATGGTASGGATGGVTSGGTASGGKSSAAGSGGLGWPIACRLGSDCTVGYPDIDADGVAFDCSAPGYEGHEGSDIGISWTQMDQGTDVYAALTGEVLWVFDGNYDRCPDDTQPSCKAPAVDGGPNVHSGYMVCTDARDEYCTGTRYTQGCYWCFYGSNVVVIRHPNDLGVFATRYDHLRRGSILVKPGQHVERGQKIAQVGSAGNSTGPHLHFEVWVGGFYQLAEPWAGNCGPNHGPSLWDPTLGLP